MIPEIKSKASFYGLPTNKFIVGQKYEFKLKIINKGADFSGGTIEILIVHADTMQRIELTGKIPEIKKNETKYVLFDDNRDYYEPEALGAGLILFTLKSLSHGVFLFKENGEEIVPGPAAFHTVYAHTFQEMAQTYSLAISAGTLVIMALNLGFWISLGSVIILFSLLIWNWFGAPRCLKIFILSQAMLAFIVAFRFYNCMPEFITPFKVMGERLQYLGYLNLSFLIAGLSSLICYVLDSIKKKDLSKKSPYLTACLAILSIIVIFYDASFLAALFKINELFYLMFFLPLIVFVLIAACIIEKRRIWIKNHWKACFVVFLMLASPFLIGWASYENAIGSAGLLATEGERVIFTAQYALNHTFSVWQLFGAHLFRSRECLPAFYVLGFSACGELGYIQRCMLDRLGIENRGVLLLENHGFNEVLINGTWMATDPGYADCHFLSTWERGQKRIDELGGLSVAYTVAPNGSIVWRTQDYVPVDWVTIRILNGAVPLSDGKITISRTAPMEVTLDEEGSVTIPIGDLRGFKDGKTGMTVSVSGKDFQISSLGEGRRVDYCYSLEDGSLTESVG
ncbi:MAG: hypothetical protein ABC588_07150 [Candidatus Methanosuratincola petrocarbonis]